MLYNTIVDVFFSEEFLDCEVIASQRLGTSPYRMLRLKLPVDRAHLSIPFLNHVLITVTDAFGQNHTRPYTPTCLDFSLEEEAEENARRTNSTEISILIKVYQNGRVSQALDGVREGLFQSFVLNLLV